MSGAYLGTMNRLHSKNVPQRSVKKMISQHPFGEKEKDGDLMGYLIQASLFSGHGIATKALEGMLGISYTPLKNRLSILRQERLLVEEKIGREKFYRLNLTEFEKQIEKRD